MPSLPSPQGFQFPPRRDAVKGQWAPLFIEPVVGSGERICIGIVAASEMETLLVPVAALDRLECLYGKGVDALMLASRVSLDYSRDLLSARKEEAFRIWKAPMDGVFIGPPVRSEGNSLEEIARNGMTASSSLVDKLTDAEGISEEQGTAITSNRLEELVKAKVVAVRPPLAERFRVHRKIRENARPAVIGFIGTRIAANFAMLMPGKLGSYVNLSKAKLWDLAQLREDVTRGDIFPNTVNRFELLVYRPRTETPEYSLRQMNTLEEAVVELTAEADKVDIRCRSAVTHEEMASTLLEAEAA